MSSDLNVLMEGETVQAPPAPARGGGRGGGSKSGSTGSTSGGGGGNFYVAVANLRVREACDKGANVIDDIPKTDIIEVLEERGDWFRIKMDGFDSAWILARNKARELVEKCDAPAGYSASTTTSAPPAPVAPTQKEKVKASPTPVAAAAASSGGGGSYYIVAANMNARASPDGSSDQVSDLMKGDVCKVLEEKDDWFRIDLRGRSDLWIKHRNKVKSLVTECDSATGEAKWLKQEAGGVSLTDDEEEKKKKVNITTSLYIQNHSCVVVFSIYSLSLLPYSLTASFYLHRMFFFPS